MPRWIKSPSDFADDKNYYKRLRQDVEAMFQELKASRRDRQLYFSKPFSNDPLPYALADLEERVKFLRNQVDGMHAQLDQVLTLIPELIAERDRLKAQAEPSESEQEFLNWIKNLGLDSLDAHDWPLPPAE